MQPPRLDGQGAKGARPGGKAPPFAALSRWVDFSGLILLSADQAEEQACRRGRACVTLADDSGHPRSSAASIGFRICALSCSTPDNLRLLATPGPHQGALTAQILDDPLSDE